MYQHPETRISGEVPDSCVVTLTYADPNLPKDGLLKHADFQNFTRRLHYNHGRTRHFMCGEYGGKTQRPHFHAVIFGKDFDDKYKVQLSDGQVVQFSDELDALWSNQYGKIGNATVETLTFEGAGYVAGYVAKKLVEMEDPRRMVEVVDPEDGTVRYEDPGPEYREMTRNPAIGRKWIEEHLDEVYPADVVRVGPYKFKPPRYYDSVLKRVDERLYREVLQTRLEGEAEYAQTWTPERATAALNIFVDEKSNRRKDSL